MMGNSKNKRDNRGKASAEKSIFTHNRICFAIIIVLIILLSLLMAKHIKSSDIKEIITPEFQKKYEIRYTIQEVGNEEAVYDIEGGTETFLRPASEAIKYSLIAFVNMLCGFFLMRLFREKCKVIDISKLLRTCEMVIIIIGIFAFVYNGNTIDNTKYGLYKSELEKSENKTYYEVKAIPTGSNYPFEKGNVFQQFIANGERVTVAFNYLIALSGALFLPFKNYQRRVGEENSG